MQLTKKCIQFEYGIIFEGNMILHSYEEFLASVIAQELYIWTDQTDSSYQFYHVGRNFDLQVDLKFHFRFFENCDKWDIVIDEIEISAGSTLPEGNVFDVIVSKPLLAQLIEENVNGD